MAQSKDALKAKLVVAKKEFEREEKINKNLQIIIKCVKEENNYLKLRNNTLNTYLGYKDKEIEERNEERNEKINKYEKIIFNLKNKIRILEEGKFIIARTPNRKRKIIVRT